MWLFMRRLTNEFSGFTAMGWIQICIICIILQTLLIPPGYFVYIYDK